MSRHDFDLSASLAFSSFKRWIASELRPQQVIKSITAAVLNFVMEIIVVISMAALIFSGDLSSQVSTGIGLIVLGDSILCLVVALLSSYAGSIAIEQDAPSALVALAVASVLSSMPAGAGVDQKVATVVIMNVVIVLATGGLLVLLGYFKLGGLARYIPYPVMGGFLAGTGWLLASGGVTLMAGSSQGMALFQPSILTHWLPGLILALVLLLAGARFSSPLALPGIFFGGIALFYLASWVANMSLAQLGAQGWLLGPFSGSGQWQFPLSVDRLAQTNWPAITGQAGAIASILVISVIGLLLNANGLELIVKRDIDLNHELLITGFANLVASLGGGIVGYHAVSLSSLNYTMSGGKRLPGILMGVALGATVFLGAAVFSYIPKFVLGGLLVYLGLSLLVEWGVRALSRFTKIESAIILVIVMTIATVGFLEGIGVGILATVILFVISYSRIDVVRHKLSGDCYRSQVNRSDNQRKMLAEHGEQLYILQLQGFIFFGTATRLYEQLRKRVRETSTIPVRYIILDFARVSGLDSTALLGFAKILQLTRGSQIVLALTAVSTRMQMQLNQSGLMPETGILEQFADLDHGVEWYEDRAIGEAGQADSPAQPLRKKLGIVLPDESQVTRLLSYLDKESVKAGHHLMRQGDPPDALYFVESGRVTAQLERSGQAPMRLQSMAGENIVGEIGLYLDTARTASVIADEPSTVYRLSKDALRRMREYDPDLAAALHEYVAHIMAERLVHLTRTVDALMM